MAKMTKDEYKAILKQKTELFELLLKRTGVKKEDVFLFAMDEFITANIDKISESELKQFDKLVYIQ